MMLTQWLGDGRYSYSYIRLSKLIKYSFYKNLAFTIMPLWFGFSSAFAGQTLHDAWIMTCYNMIYTSLPPLMHGLFEKDIDEETILAHPKTYDVAGHAKSRRRLTIELRAGIATPSSVPRLSFGCMRSGC